MLLSKLKFFRYLGLKETEIQIVKEEIIQSDPRRLVPAHGEFALRSHNIPRGHIEHGALLHHLLGPHHHLLIPAPVHMVDNITEIAARHVTLQGPGGVDIPHTHGRIGQLRYQTVPEEQTGRDVQALAVDDELDVAHDPQVQSGGRDDDVRWQE